MYLDTTLCIYVGTYLCGTSRRHEQHQSTSHIGCTTSTQLINSKQPKVSPTKQLINFILPLADTVLGDSKYLRYVCLIVSKVPVQLSVVQHETREKKTCSCAQDFFFSSDYVHIVVVSCKVALHVKTEDFFLVYGPCSKYKVLPLRTCRYM